MSIDGIKGKLPFFNRNIAFMNSNKLLCIYISTVNYGEHKCTLYTKYRQ